MRNEVKTPLISCLSEGCFLKCRALLERGLLRGVDFKVHQINKTKRKRKMKGMVTEHCGFTLVTSQEFLCWRAAPRARGGAGLGKSRLVQPRSSMPRGPGAAGPPTSTAVCGSWLGLGTEFGSVACAVLRGDVSEVTGPRSSPSTLGFRRCLPSHSGWHSWPQRGAGSGWDFAITKGPKTSLYPRHKRSLGVGVKTHEGETMYCS